MALNKVSEEDINKAILGERFSRNECVLRFLSLVCLFFMFGLFIIQIDLLWRSRESLLMEMLHRDIPEVFINYPEFYDIPHNEETWTWDPDTLLLKVIVIQSAALGPVVIEEEKLPVPCYCICKKYGLQILGLKNQRTAWSCKI